MTRSPAFRHWQQRRPIGHLWWVRIPVTSEMTSMCDWAQYRYWPDWTCTASGRVTETVSDTHNSGDFIAFLQKLDSAYPEHHQIRLVLDNHSAHISKETRGYLQTMPQRFVFVFTPKHGSWLNLIENQFSKMTRTSSGESA